MKPRELMEMAAEGLFLLSLFVIFTVWLMTWVNWILGVKPPTLPW